MQPVREDGGQGGDRLGGDRRGGGRRRGDRRGSGGTDGGGRRLFRKKAGPYAEGPADRDDSPALELPARPPSRADVASTGERRVGWALRWLPAMLILIGAVFYWVTPEGLTSSPFFESAPLVAAGLLSLRATVLTAVIAIIVNVVLEIGNGTADYSESIIEMISQCVIGGLAIGMNVLIMRNYRRLTSARHVAVAAQRAVLPNPPAGFGPLLVAARYRAADADARIGGDLYAVQESPYGVRCIVGDVRGKGLEAVESVAVVIGAFREAAEEEPGLAGVARRLERALQRQETGRSGLDRVEGFTTAVLAQVDRDCGRLRLLNRGHPAPMLLGADGAARMLHPREHALPLGMGELGTWPDELLEVPFPPGSALVLFTDGVTEARNKAGVFYDPLTRLGGQVFDGPHEVLDTLLDDVTRYTGGRVADDMALFSLARSRTPSGTPPAPPSHAHAP
ncbi:PP2C family protein-serine/threonine phosphatase [Streptomyces sp. WMMC500]|uniref:PP2C family protein-serine/threonine phosphatase n=1 Tax=Streptomyces sp. WMMC500 TaxID=3015154 RepID=UPI00248C9E3F|nr:PP2C family protein-serine/threonine phosphatase [Streptomyces sp. WMMC500]WBB63983.1 PP2C family protein-serine/threonine phosphatase [Streptomyces sp. WMMC500]